MTNLSNFLIKKYKPEVNMTDFTIFHKKYKTYVNRSDFIISEEKTINLSDF